MRKKGEVRFRVEGRWFRLMLTLGDDISYVVCDPEEGGSLLGCVVSSAWRRGPRALLNSLRTRSGLSFEGSVGFGYDDEDSSSPEGVTLVEFGATETVSEAFFERFVVEFGLAYLDAARAAGDESGEGLRPELLAMRARLDKGERLSR